MLGASSTHSWVWTGQRTSLIKLLNPSSVQAELPEEGFRVILYPRVLKHAVRTFNLNMIHSWVTLRPGTRESRIQWMRTFLRTRKSVWEYLGHGFFARSNASRVLGLALEGATRSDFSCKEVDSGQSPRGDSREHELWNALL